MTGGSSIRKNRETNDPDRAAMRECARMTCLRPFMSKKALSTHKLILLDDRIARWTTDTQTAGKLP